MTFPKLRCRTVRAWIEVDHDGRLHPRRRVALEAHLEGCADCRTMQAELTELGAALRAEAAEHRPDDGDFTRISPEVLSTLALEQDTSWHQRLRDLFEERRRLWFVSGAVGATSAALLLVASLLSLGVGTHPLSLANLFQTSPYLGSNTNPVWQPGGISLPHVAPDTRSAAILIQPFPPLELKHLALSAVVSQEGSLTSVEVLQDETPDAEMTKALTRLASDMRFVPAQARGRAIAMNVVWVLERTTVAPSPPPPGLGGA